jgi:hypothetical protein
VKKLPHDYGADCSVAVVTPAPVANGFYWVLEEVSPLREACKTTLLPLTTPKYVCVKHTERLSSACGK